MPTADEVEVVFEARVGQYQADLRNAARTFEQTTRTQEARMQVFERRISAIAGRVGTAIGGIFTIGAAREVLRLVDAGKQIEAQLRLATRETGNFAQAQEDVRRIAALTRTGLDETSRLYSVFQRDSQALGITQMEAARATETLTKSFLISGASAVETSQSTRQLIQGLQSGTLRGDEFNSVMEAAPRLQKLFAEALGVSKGELRALAEDGKITAAALVDALTNKRFTAGIDEEFRDLPVTFDQAMQQVENAAIITFSAFDRGGGFSQMLSNFVMDGTRGFGDLEQSAIDTGIDIRSTFEGLANVFEPLLDAARATFGEIGGEATTLAGEVRNLLEGFDRLNKIGQNPVEDWIDKNIWGIKPRASLAQLFNEGQSRSAAERRAAVAAQQNPPSNRGSGSPARSTPQRTTRPSRRSGPSAETLAARAERERLNSIREEGTKQRDLLGLQDDILAARAALATAAADVARFEEQQLSVEQAARTSDLWTQKRLGELSEAEYEVRAASLAEQFELRRQLVDRRRAETEATEAAKRADEEADRQALSRRDSLATLQAEADLARTRKERAAVERRILDLAYADEEAAIRRAAAAGQVADLDEALANLRRRRVADEEMLSRQSMSPLQGYRYDLEEQSANINDAVEQLGVDTLQSFNGELAQAITNFESLGDVGLAALHAITEGLVRLALQQIIVNTLAKAFGDGQKSSAETAAAEISKVVATQLALQAVQASMGTAAAAAAAAQAAGVAAAWAPAAAAASLATLGGNAAPAAAALIGTNALATALAIPRRDGGPIYGPGGPTQDQVLMAASPGEYVVRAWAAKRLGRPALDHLNATGILPNGARPTDARSMGLDPAFRKELKAAVADAARAMPPINLYPTLDPGSVLRAALDTPDGRRAMFNFVSQNPGKFRSQLE